MHEITKVAWRIISFFFVFIRVRLQQYLYTRYIITRGWVRTTSSLEIANGNYSFYDFFIRCFRRSFVNRMRSAVVFPTLPGFDGSNDSCLFFFFVLVTGNISLLWVIEKKN